MILGNWLIFHVLPLVWEIVRQTNRLGTRFLCFRNVHLKAPLYMHYCTAFIGCLFSRLWRCIVSTWKRTPGSCIIGEWFMHWTTLAEWKWGNCVCRIAIVVDLLDKVSKKTSSMCIYLFATSYYDYRLLHIDCKYQHILDQLIWRVTRMF